MRKAPTAHSDRLNRNGILSSNDKQSAMFVFALGQWADSQENMYSIGLQPKNQLTLVLFHSVLLPENLSLKPTLGKRTTTPKTAIILHSTSLFSRLCNQS